METPLFVNNLQEELSQLSLILVQVINRISLLF